MTSWIATSGTKKKIAPTPTSYFNYREGTFTKKTKEATIVLAFYDIPSKDSLEKRKETLQQFLQVYPSNVLLFTQHDLADELAMYRMGLEKQTRVVVLDSNEWIANTKYIPSLWTQQVKQDPELRLGRSAEEFQYGYEKKEFMAKAVEMNPFQSDDFVWIDTSFLASLNQISSRFPITDKIPTDRILVANPEPITADDIASSYFRGKNRISNTILAGSKKAWQDYAKLYDVIIAQKLKLSGFIGDDLVVLQYTIIHKPNQFSLVPQASLVNELSI